MRKLKLEVQISVDVFIADGDGNTTWMIWNWSDQWNWDEALKQYHIDLTTSCDCILISRKMAEEGFVHHWEKVANNPSNSQHAFAKHITEIPKLVFTKTLKESRWRNTQIVNRDFVDEINQLKSKKGKDIIVYGGATFASSLISTGLIDEFHLIVNPTVLGSGMSIFKELKNRLDLSLLTAKSYNCGVIVLIYAPTKNNLRQLVI